MTKLALVCVSLATLFLALAGALGRADAQVRIVNVQLCPLIGTWESWTEGYARYVFDRRGNYTEFIESVDPKTRVRRYRVEASGQYLLNVRELRLRHRERYFTTFEEDGTAERTRKYGRSERLVFVLMPTKDRIQITDTDGTKRWFVRTKRD